MPRVHPILGVGTVRASENSFRSWGADDFDASARFRQVRAVLGAWACTLLEAALVRDLSWAALEKQGDRNGETGWRTDLRRNARERRGCGDYYCRRLGLHVPRIGDLGGWRDETSFNETRDTGSELDLLNLEPGNSENSGTLRSAGRWDTSCSTRRCRTATRFELQLTMRRT
jgi:hypothetical protein